MTAYVDSSAIAKLVLVEPESPALRAHLAGDEPWATSALARTEVIRAVGPAGPAAVAHARAVLQRADLVAVSLAILEDAAELTIKHRVRTLDAIHLATAAELDHVDELVTYDRRMASVAGDLGFTVTSP